MSLRVRINLIMTALIMLFTLVTGSIIVNDMRSSIREEMEAGGKVTQQLLSQVLTGTHQQAGAVQAHPNQILLDFLQDIQQRR